jgi:hypothetical protein
VLKEGMTLPSQRSRSFIYLVVEKSKISKKHIQRKFFGGGNRLPLLSSLHLALFGMKRYK